MTRLYCVKTKDSSDGEKDLTEFLKLQENTSSNQTMLRTSTGPSNHFLHWNKFYSKWSQAKGEESACH